MKVCDLTCLFTAFLITAIRAIVLSITAPWQPHTSTRHTAKLIGHAHRCTWTSKRRPGHTSLYITILMYPGMDETFDILQFFSSDWSSQSYSPSHLQPAFIHIPLLHMNSAERHGWCEAARKQNQIMIIVFSKSSCATKITVDCGRGERIQHDIWK